MSIPLPWVSHPETRWKRSTSSSSEKKNSLQFSKREFKYPSWESSIISLLKELLKVEILFKSRNESLFLPPCLPSQRLTLGLMTSEAFPGLDIRLEISLSDNCLMHFLMESSIEMIDYLYWTCCSSRGPG